MDVGVLGKALSSSFMALLTCLRDCLNVLMLWISRAMIKWLEDASSSVVVAIFPGVGNYSGKENDVIEVRGF